MAAGCENTCFTEERLTKLIKSIFKEEFKRQQQDILNTISGNFDIQMSEIRELNTKVSDLKQSLEFKKDALEERVNDLKSENEKFKTKKKELYEYQIYPEFVENKLVELEDRSSRCNLRIDGVKETSNETWEKCEEHLETLFKDKLGIEENIIFERAHGTKSSPEGRRSQPRTIFCKFHNCKDKVKVLQNAKKLKGTNISINEDFSQ